MEHKLVIAAIIALAVAIGGLLIYGYLSVPPLVRSFSYYNGVPVTACLYSSDAYCLSFISTLKSQHIPYKLYNDSNGFAIYTTTKGKSIMDNISILGNNSD